MTDQQENRKKKLTLKVNEDLELERVEGEELDELEPDEALKRMREIEQKVLRKGQCLKGEFQYRMVFEAPTWELTK